LYKRFTSTIKIGAFLTFILSTSVITRVLVMTLVNYVVIWMLFPTFLQYAAISLATSLKITFSTNFDVLILTLLITAIFNVIHVPLSTIPSYIMVTHILNRGVLITFEGPWIVRMLKRLP
ncbi:MAG: hypothetical protein N3F06_02795, partial [Nitrososphaerales archaeon]|nr:hypothetical protein [Nitrososphaerales archaeon]